MQRELARTAADAAGIYRSTMSREMLARERALRAEIQVGGVVGGGVCSVCGRAVWWAVWCAVWCAVCAGRMQRSRWAVWAVGCVVCVGEIGNVGGVTLGGVVCSARCVWVRLAVWAVCGGPGKHRG